MFTDAVSYPIRRGGWIMILLGGIFSAILNFLQFAPLFGLVVAIFSAGFFGSFYLNIVSTTMMGRDEVPDWPEFSCFMDDIVSPFLRLTFLVLVSFFPIIILYFIEIDPEWILPALVGAVIYSCLYFPMSVLAVQAFGGLGAALPHIVIPAMFRAMPGYLLAVLALVGGIGVCLVAETFTSEIPYLGWFLTALVALYSLMFQARMIGLIYRNKSERLGWE